MYNARKNVGAKPKFAPFRLTSNAIMLKDAPIFEGIDRPKKKRRTVKVVNSLKHQEHEVVNLEVNKATEQASKTVSPYGARTPGSNKKSPGIVNRLYGEPFKVVDPFEIMTAEPEEDEFAEELAAQEKPGEEKPAIEETGEEKTIEKGAGEKGSGGEENGEERSTEEKTGVEKPGEEKADGEKTGDVRFVVCTGNSSVNQEVEKSTPAVADEVNTKEVIREEDILEIDADCSTWKDADDNIDDISVEKSVEKRHKKHKKAEKREKSEKGEKRKKRRKEKNKTEDENHERRHKKRRRDSGSKSRNRSSVSPKRRRNSTGQDHLLDNSRKDSNEQESLPHKSRSRSPVRRAKSPVLSEKSKSSRERMKSKDRSPRRKSREKTPRGTSPREQSFRTKSLRSKSPKARSPTQRSPREVVLRPEFSRDKSPRPAFSEAKERSPQEKSGGVKSPLEKPPREELPREKSAKEKTLRAKSPGGKSGREKYPRAKSPKATSLGQGSPGPAEVVLKPEISSAKSPRLTSPTPREKEISPRDKSAKVKSPRAKSPRGRSTREKATRAKSPRETSAREEFPQAKSSTKEKTPRAKSPRSKSLSAKSPRAKSPGEKSPRSKSPKEKPVIETSNRAKSPKGKFMPEKEKSLRAKSPRHSSKGSASKSPDRTEEKHSKDKSSKVRKKSRNDEKSPTKKHSEISLDLKGERSHNDSVHDNVTPDSPKTSQVEVKECDKSLSESPPASSKPQLKSYVHVVSAPARCLVPYGDDVVSISPQDSPDGLTIEPKIDKVEEEDTKSPKTHRSKDSKHKGSSGDKTEQPKKLKTKRKSKKEKRKKKVKSREKPNIDDELEDLLFTKTNKEEEVFNDSEVFSAKHNLQTAVVDLDAKKLKTVSSPTRQETLENTKPSSDNKFPENSPDPFEKLSEISEAGELLASEPPVPQEYTTLRQKNSPKDSPTSKHRPTSKNASTQSGDSTIPFLAVDKKQRNHVEEPVENDNAHDSPEEVKYSPGAPYSPEERQSPKINFSPLGERYSPEEPQPSSQIQFSPLGQRYSPVEVSDFGSPKKSSTMNLSDISTKNPDVENTLGIITPAEKVEDFLGRIESPKDYARMNFVSHPTNGLKNNNEDDIIEQLHKEFVREQTQKEIMPGMYLDKNASVFPRAYSPLHAAASDPIVQAYGSTNYGTIVKPKRTKKSKKLKSSKKVKHLAKEKKDIEDALNRVHRQARVEDEMKHALKEYFKRKEITKEEYKMILRKAVPQVANSNHGIDPERIRSLVKKYVAKYKGSRERRAKRGARELQEVPFTFSP